MSLITDCKSDSDFTAFLVKAEATPVIVDFYATWCGPCNMIAPTFRDLAGKYPQLKFVKVDVDKCPQTKTKFEIAAMPTFVAVISGQRMDLIKGADPNALHNFVKKWAENAAPLEPSPVPGQSDLGTFIDKSGVECLNEDDSKNIQGLLGGRSELRSDCDEQLIINIPFVSPVKIHSIEIRGKGDHGPKDVKVFANVTTTLDFDNAQNAEPIQNLNFEADSLQNLKFVKFQNVKNIQLFIANNKGDHDVTIIEDLRLYGQVLGQTQMTDFKRVAGKVGEVGH
ncbi:unnamed protein product [Bursaphelenchus xylophilus]|uniref:(pine wood nematode) hypothetical protein n=1 Tax=Bursaphelenchus xylophilus TaxID=6326 RepID=A0A1I7S632_BURXY|nr:unnamed protein product [Bursaphelenchus xylophilus]CAG9082324.1 unnamed protein product [Bursaphelenchus xylophilus]